MVSGELESNQRCADQQTWGSQAQVDWVSVSTHLIILQRTGLQSNTPSKQVGCNSEKLSFSSNKQKCAAPPIGTNVKFTSPFLATIGLIKGLVMRTIFADLNPHYFFRHDCIFFTYSFVMTLQVLQSQRKLNLLCC